MKSSNTKIIKIKLEDIPATFYVGPVGVLVVSEFPLIAETEARRVREDSQGAIPVLPVVRVPGLKESRGRVGGLMALRDEGAIRGYLRGKCLLDDDEVVMVAGWLGNRRAPVPPIRPKEGLYCLKGEEVVERRLKILLLTGKSPDLPLKPRKPHPLRIAGRVLSFFLRTIRQLLPGGASRTRKEKSFFYHAREKASGRRGKTV